MLGRPGRVAVCACTYLRPAGLERLLAGLAAIEVPGGVAVEVVIVDNDAAGSGRAGVGAAPPGVPVPRRDRWTRWPSSTTTSGPRSGGWPSCCGWGRRRAPRW